MEASSSIIIGVSSSIIIGREEELEADEDKEVEGGGGPREVQRVCRFATNDSGNTSLEAHTLRVRSTRSLFLLSTLLKIKGRQDSRTSAHASQKTVLEIKIKTVKLVTRQKARGENKEMIKTRVCMDGGYVVRLLFCITSLQTKRNGMYWWLGALLSSLFHSLTS